METFLATFLVLMLAVAGMSVGVIVSNRRIKGSCGGLNNVPGLGKACSCDEPCEKRKQRDAEAAARGEM